MSRSLDMLSALSTVAAQVAGSGLNPESTSPSDGTDPRETPCRSAVMSRTHSEEMNPVILRSPMHSEAIPGELAKDTTPAMSVDLLEALQDPADSLPIVNKPQTDSFMSVRRLTPVECEILQGFPKGWTVPGIAL